MTPNDLSAELRRELLSTRNGDGGWAYYAGKRSRVEPTAWASLALAVSGEPASGVFARWPTRDGWLLDAGSGEVNVGFNGLAAIALTAMADRPEAAVPALRAALLREKGIKLPPSAINRQDNSLQGWAWSRGTFSWVEPTAWGLLGLKRLTRGARDDASQARIGEAERLLLDRMCRAGGWNHGNSNMLGTELPPYVSTSALGLLAMQDLRDREPIAGTARYVQAHRVDEPSAMALGLTAIALGIYGIPVGDVTEALAAEWRRARFIGNLHVMALALYAVTGARKGYEAFRV